ncbi:hypothetical protein C7N83_10025 [Neisseria iguanae]|uniref:Uncharacterized protein n=1 Tax=Neisseria iguanae TaxID=90242 RepID=A0A2P7TYK6_9NEIS|nr:hypothetical protein C7N83_10025 [Neisseria iguanae]
MRNTKIYEIITPVSDADGTFQLRYILTKTEYLNLRQVSSFEEAVYQYERHCRTCAAPLRVVSREDVK